MLIFYNYEMSNKYFELHIFIAEFLALTPPNRLNCSFLLLLVNSTEAAHLESTYSPSVLPPLLNSKESSCPCLQNIPWIWALFTISTGSILAKLLPFLPKILQNPSNWSTHLFLYSLFSMYQSVFLFTKIREFM